MQLKVCLVVFGNISSKGQSGLSLFHYRLADYFYTKGVLKSIYCLDHDSNLPFKDIKVIGLWKNPLFYVLVKLLQFVKKQKGDFTLRLVEEKLFDWYFSKKDFFKDTTVVISTKPVNPGIIKICNTHSIRSLVIATVAHPLFIKGVIQQLEKRYGVVDSSSYSQIQRINRLQETFRLTDMVIPRISSNFVVNSYINFGVPAQKVTRLTSDNYIDTDLYKPDHSERTQEVTRFITAGFMNLKKGLPLLLEVWQELKLKEQLDHCELVVVGDLDNVTSEVIGKMGKLSEVVFKGHQRKIQRLYQSADVFIASSVSDLGPRTVQEAMACGLPAIVSSNCGMADYVNDGITGFVYDPFDLESLKKHILFFANNSVRTFEMGKAARESCLKTTSKDAFIEELYSLCTDLVKGN